MMETVKIKCPCCGVILAVKSQSGLEDKSITCPVCKEKNPYESFKMIEMSGGKSEHTEYPHQPMHNKNDKEETKFKIGDSAQNFTLGKLVLPNGQLPYTLQPGKNIIGRKAKASTANCQISTGENKRMSREHLVIDVKKVPGKGFVHYASLFKQKVNDTFINDEKLEFGDCIVLQHGDTLRLPDVIVKFVIPDDECTM